MFKAAEWARKKNSELKKTGLDSEDEMIKKIIDEGATRSELLGYFACSLPKKYEFVGKVLAIAVILAIVLFFSFVLYALI